MEAPTCRKEITLEIPEDAVARESEQVTAQYARVARIPGFRPGRAPRPLVAKRFREEIRSEVVQALVPKYFEESVQSQNLMVAGEPRFEDLQFEDGKPLRAKASFEVYPEIKLKEYKGLEVASDPVAVTDEEVDEALERLRQRSATFEPIEDRAAGNGDYVAVSDQRRKVSGRETASEAGALEDQSAEVRESLIEIGGKGVAPEFSENLLGTRAGDLREFEVNYPDDFHDRRLAGRKMNYRVEVQGVKKKVLPPLDDELAKSVSDFSTLASFRSQLRQDLEGSKQRRAEDAVRQRLLGALIAAHDFPVPETLVEGQLRRRMERTVGALVAQGVDPRAGIDWARIREDMRPDAAEDVRGMLLLDKIAAAEKIDVTEEEIDEALREGSRGGQETAAALKTRLTQEDGLARLRTGIRQKKALDLVYHAARINSHTTASKAVGSKEARILEVSSQTDEAGEESKRS